MEHRLKHLSHVNHYRDATISLDYFYTSIMNSISDDGVCLLGVLLVKKTNWKRSSV
ncbi:MAG TPA: hypothetical protein DEF45_19825 [Rhodopirellula sp.]|nr:hypothetical protein [Rhodopirellula sp.]